MPTQKPFFKICSRQHKHRNDYVMVLDVGTSGVKAFVFDGEGTIRAKAYKILKKFRPKPNLVEQDPRELIEVSKKVLKKVLKDSGLKPRQIKGLGITNQREAAVVWDRKTGKPVYPVIGWEDKRTRGVCEVLRRKHNKRVQEQTGLPIDSYFSASKVQWILRHVPGVSELLEQERLAFGTIDTWLLWNLCDGNPHVTDETNASRTLLFDIRKRQWSLKLCRLFDVPMDVLPMVLPSRASFGLLSKKVFGHKIPVLAVCGDQQASSYGAMCVRNSNMPVTKVTYGTGVFVVQVIGKRFQLHRPFFTTLVPDRRNGSAYALEAKIEGSGETVTELLAHPQKLEIYFQHLTKRVSLMLDKLPHRPRHIVIDGGIARDGIVLKIQEKVSKIPACLQDPFDGTALGCALLVWDEIG